ncbi:hypothetical protein F5884DRAFT_174715 [Xylogone sp. PMI_703]|nr:hypothetical protein F5884DRAFT_174715 [Xylogone sp. PMI_703]
MMFKNAALALSIMAALASTHPDGDGPATVTVHDCGSTSATTESFSVISTEVGTSTVVTSAIEVSTTATTSPAAATSGTVGSTGAALPTQSGGLPFNNTATIASFSAIGMIIASSFVLVSFPPPLHFPSLHFSTNIIFSSCKRCYSILSTHLFCSGGKMDARSFLSTFCLLILCCALILCHARRKVANLIGCSGIDRRKLLCTIIQRHLP